MPMLSSDVVISSFLADIDYPITTHASERMVERRIPQEAIDAVLLYGREIPTRGGVVYAIGRKEVAHYARDGVDLDEFNGVHVVCSLEGVVLTVYRNHDFRQLRVGLGRGRFNRYARRQVNRFRTVS